MASPFARSRSANQPDRWRPHDIDTWRRETLRMRSEARSAYSELLDELWLTGPLPDDNEQLAMIARVSDEQWTRLRPMLEGSFEVRKGHWHHPRLQTERKYAVALMQRQSRAGKVAAASRWGAAGEDARRNPDASEPQCDSHTPSPSSSPLPLPLPTSLPARRGQSSPSPRVNGDDDDRGGDRAAQEIVQAFLQLRSELFPHSNKHPSPLAKMLEGARKLLDMCGQVDHSFWTECRSDLSTPESFIAFLLRKRLEILARDEKPAAKSPLFIRDTLASQLGIDTGRVPQ